MLLVWAAVEPYLLDLLSCHENRISLQPNSIHVQDDGQQQMAALTVMRAVLHHFCPRDSRYGPFVFTLTDLHQSRFQRRFFVIAQRSPVLYLRWPWQRGLVFAPDERLAVSFSYRMLPSDSLQSNASNVANALPWFRLEFWLHIARNTNRQKWSDIIVIACSRSIGMRTTLSTQKYAP